MTSRRSPSMLASLSLGVVLMIGCSKKVDLIYCWKSNGKCDYDGVSFVRSNYQDASKSCEEFKNFLERICSCQFGLSVENVQRNPRDFQCRQARECGLTWDCREK